MKYAIIETGGKQYWVAPNETVKVDRLTAEKGKEVAFDALWSAEGAAKAKVVAEVVRELRGPKIIVFRKRSKKAYKKTRGHRQYLTEIRIKSISKN